MYVTTKNAGKSVCPLKHFICPKLDLSDIFWYFMLFSFLSGSEFDRHEILLYEEVAKVPPFKRKTLILIGAQGVGRRRLKNKLLLRDPLLFGTTIPCMKSQVQVRICGFIYKTSLLTCYPEK